jgi:hypothetical protein
MSDQDWPDSWIGSWPVRRDQRSRITPQYCGLKVCISETLMYVAGMSTLCQCGCGNAITSKTRSSRPPQRFIKGHNVGVRTLTSRNCPYCNTIFQPVTKTQKCCSARCGSMTAGLKRRRRVARKCEVCGLDFVSHQCRKDARFCSKSCWEVRNPPTEKVCRHCKKTFLSRDANATSCSRRCATSSRTGEKASRWKGGVSLHNERARDGVQLKQWRSAVFKRDDFTCCQCGSRDQIQAHHIRPWAEFHDLRFVVENGTTLCVICHGKVHGKDFSNRRNKKCPSCGATTKGKGKGGQCRSCSITAWHRDRSSLG